MGSVMRPVARHLTLFYIWCISFLMRAYHFLNRWFGYSPDPYLRATITLHNPYLDFTDSQCISTARCVNSARSILAAYYMLSATSLDITRLHPFVTVSDLCCTCMSNSDIF